MAETRKKTYRSISPHRGITIAIIPPGNQNIKRIFINYSLVSFILAILISVIFLSIFSPFLASLVKEEKKDVIPVANAWITTILISNDFFNGIDDRLDILKEEGVEIHKLIWDSEDYYHVDSDDRRERIVENTKYLRTALQFLANREKVLRSLPVGYPIEGGYTTSPFGSVRQKINQETHEKGVSYHTGYDIANSYGTPIKVTAPGVVVFAGYSDTGYGNYVTVEHRHGFETLYAHCMALNVQEGQRVKRGDVIAFLGSTGNSTGAHVHYEVRLKHPASGEIIFLNPWPYIDNKL